MDEILNNLDDEKDILSSYNENPDFDPLNPLEGCSHGIDICSNQPEDAIIESNRFQNVIPNNPVEQKAPSGPKKIAVFYKDVFAFNPLFMEGRETDRKSVV